MSLTDEERLRQIDIELELLELEEMEEQESASAPLSMAETVQGAGQMLNEGLYLGWGDEGSSVIRAGLDRFMPNAEYDFGGGVQEDMRPAGADYEMYLDDSTRNREQFQAENPGTALGLELAGALLSPVNRIAPGFGSGRGAANAGKALTRAGVEGAVAGAGADQDDRLGGALSGLGFGVGTTGALRGLGGAGGLISSRKVKESLEQEDGSFKPLSLTDEEGLLGTMYREWLGRVWGAKRVLRDQEKPFLEAAESRVNTVEDQLTDLAQSAEDTFTTAKRALDDETGEAATALTNTKKAEIAQAKEALAQVEAEESANFLNLAARESLPESARGRLADANGDPQKLAKALDDYWTKEAFNEVKGRQFNFDGTLRNQLKEMLDNDPGLELELEDVVGRVAGMQARLGGVPSQTAMDALDAMLGPGKRDFLVDGEALMAMRNVFARGANGNSTYGRGALRAVANQFDDVIRKQLDGKSRALFDEHIDRYTTNLSFQDAAGGVAAREAGGGFKPRDWMRASGKYSGRQKKATGGAPLETQARDASQRIRSQKEGMPGVKERAGERLAKAKAALEERTTERSRGLTDTLKAAKRGIQKERKKGSLAEAKKERKNLKSLASPERASGLSSLLTTSALGGVGALAGTAIGASLPLSIAAGVLSGRQLVRPGMQKALAGQTRAQEKYIEMMDEGTLTPLSRALSRQAAMYGEF
jgi:hypothetical protein